MEQTSKLIRWVQMEMCDAEVAEVAELHHAMTTVSPKFFEVFDIWFWRTMLIDRDEQVLLAALE